MNKITQVLFKFLIRLLLTPILLMVTLIILIFYSLIGCVIVPAQSLRYMGLTTLAAIQSAFLNRDYTHIFLDGLYEFCKKYVAFYGQIFYIPLAIWVPAEDNPSNLLKILHYQWKVISQNWLSTIIVFTALIFSFAISFSLLGLRGLDYFHLNRLKERIFYSSDTPKLITDTTSTVLLRKANNKIDSLQTVIDNLKTSEKPEKEIQELQAENQPVENEALQIKTYLVEPHEGLYAIARKFGVTIDQLRELNNLTSDNLQIGQQLTISK